MLEVILAFLGSICPGVLFNVEKRNLVWVGLTGTLGWVTYVWFKDITSGIVVSTFIGAVFVGLCSESMARVLKSPTTVFSIPGIFPLVPGISAYNTIQLVVENRLYGALEKAVETAVSAGAIAFGIMLISAIFRFVGNLVEKDKIMS